jgi:hypothetical protein
MPEPDRWLVEADVRVTGDLGQKLHLAFFTVIVGTPPGGPKPTPEEADQIVEDYLRESKVPTPYVFDIVRVRFASELEPD